VPRNDGTAPPSTEELYMSEKIGIETGSFLDRHRFSDDLGRPTPGIRSSPGGNDGSKAPAIEPVPSDADRLANHLEKRGLEVSFRINPDGGAPQLVIWDPVSGRTVVQVPRGSSLERSLGVVLQRTS
jgi:hypothetical protein